MTIRRYMNWYYICPKCGGKITSCPDPACEGFGHHLQDDESKEDWNCDQDVPIKGLKKTEPEEVVYDDGLPDTWYIRQVDDDYSTVLWESETLTLDEAEELERRKSEEFPNNKYHLCHENCRKGESND